jgi:hypothetical protein
MEERKGRGCVPLFHDNSCSFLLTLVVLVFASYPGFYPKTSLGGLELLRALSAFASKPSAGLSVALATNVCVDLVVPAGDVMPSFFTASTVASDRAFLGTTEDAAGAFLHHARLGAAGERSSSAAVMGALLGPAYASPSARALLGGNAALMATKLAKLGVSVVLGGRIGPKAASLLHANIHPAAPTAAEDDTHLILEYKAGETFAGDGGAGAPRANRFIITSGVPGEAPAALAEALGAASHRGAHVVVLSGLHALENIPGEERRATLEGIAGALRGRTPATLPVHVELASVATEAFLREVHQTILLPHAASLGFNEGETAALYEAVGGTYGAPGTPKDRAELTGLVPKVAGVSSALRFLFRAMPKLTRAHFHSLAHHVIAHRTVRDGEGATVSTAHPWAPHPARAAAAGALACAEQACDTTAESALPEHFYTLCPTKLGVGDTEVGSGVSSVRRLTLEQPWAAWSWPLDRNSSTMAQGLGGEAVEFAAVPVPVCASPTRTVGLGDAVSAAALAADILVA